MRPRVHSFKFAPLLSVSAMALFACGPVNHLKSALTPNETETSRSKAALTTPEPLHLPSAATQNKLVLRFKDEMLRLDGDGLVARIDRPVSFTDTIDRLADEALSNKTPLDFYRTFSRLSGTYTNLHSSAVFDSKTKAAVRTAYDLYPSIWLMTEIDSRGKPTVKIDSVEDAETRLKISEGDEVVSINGSLVSNWLDENFLYCKHPLRMQCDRNFESTLHEQILSWKTGALTYTVSHENRLVDVEVKFSEIQPQPSGSPKPKYRKCDYRADKRYPGFKMVHQGHLACLFEKSDDPNVAVLRIQSFQYRGTDPKDPIQSVQAEVNALYPYWTKHSGDYKTLVVDLLDNHGGNAPIPYYEILFQTPFQEQWVRFKKIKEFDDAKIRQNGIFWNDRAQELLYQKRLQSGEWAKLKEGEFADPSPMFCADDGIPCDEKLFVPRSHSFRGEVKVMVNEFCISSCDGFAWAMKNTLNAKFFGFPQAADAAYARLRIDAVADAASPDGFRLEVRPYQDELPKNFIVGQIVAVSQAVGPKGEIFNGRPLALEQLVPYRFDEFYPKVVLKEALK